MLSVLPKQQFPHNTVLWHLVVSTEMYLKFLDTYKLSYNVKTI